MSSCIRHGPSTPTKKAAAALFVLRGILLLEPGDHEAWLGASTWTMESSAKRLRSEHEDTMQLLFDQGALDAVVFDDDRCFLECDTPDEYAEARRAIVPAFRPWLHPRS